MRKCCHSEECRVGRRDRRSRSGDGVEVNGYTIEPGANLRGASLFVAKLPQANLRGADLPLACLVRANLVRANLEEACLYRAKLRETDLSGVDLTAAWADEEATWPPGFDPGAAGVILE